MYSGRGINLPLQSQWRGKRNSAKNQLCMLMSKCSKEYSFKGNEWGKILPLSLVLFLNSIIETYITWRARFQHQKVQDIHILCEYFSSTQVYIFCHSIIPAVSFKFKRHSKKQRHDTVFVWISFWLFSFDHHLSWSRGDQEESFVASSSSFSCICSKRYCSTLVWHPGVVC